MKDTNASVDDFIETSGRWQEEFKRLRSMLHEFPLNEKLKWGVPCYTLQNKNVVLMHGFKEYCALLFFKGALLRDDAGLLIRQSENVQSSRQIRFHGVEEIEELEPLLKAYVQQAIEVEEAGLEVVFKETCEFTVTEEFQRELDGDPALKTAFQALTPGRQRAYLLYFSSPKQAKTRQARVEKSVKRILAGKGLDD